MGLWPAGHPFSVDIVCTSVLSFNNLKLYKTKAVKTFVYLGPA